LHKTAKELCKEVLAWFLQVEQKSSTSYLKQRFEEKSYVKKFWHGSCKGKILRNLLK
tara:strand:+ start:436 stop:606 length:171 start_codon:yes stop_codon:yes gene_type:complete